MSLSLPPQSLLYTALVLFWCYSLWLVRRGGYYSGSAADYFIANRHLSHFRYSTSVAMASTLGWLAFDFPTAMMQQGHAATSLALACIVVPLGGLLLSRRQWLVSRRYNFVTPGEWFAEYYQSPTLQRLALLITLVSTVLLLAVQWQLGAELLSLLSDGWLSPQQALWAFIGVLLLSSALGGLAGVVRVESRLIWVCGLGLLWLAAWIWIQLRSSGFEFRDSAVQLALMESAQATVAQAQPWYAGEHLGRLGSLLMAFLGVHALPAFAMAVFASRSPLPFLPQQLWLSGILCGGLLICAGLVIGIGSHFLGMNPQFTLLYAEHSLSLLTPLSPEQGTADYFAQLARLLGERAPWAMAAVTLVLVGILQGSTLLFLNTCASSIVRDGVVALGWGRDCATLQRRLSIVATLVVGALVLALLHWHPPLPRQALLISFTLGTHLLPAWLGALYFPRLTRKGVLLGLWVGVTLQLAFIHSPNWYQSWGLGWLETWNTLLALGLNALLAVALSWEIHRPTQHLWRRHFHEFIRQRDRLQGLRLWLAPLAWCLVAQWLFFAFGPGRAMGERWLGHPDLPEQWLWDMPPAWLWLLLCWLFGLMILAIVGHTLNVSGLPSPAIKRLPLQRGSVLGERQT